MEGVIYKNGNNGIVLSLRGEVYEFFRIIKFGVFVREMLIWFYI